MAKTQLELCTKIITCQHVNDDESIGIAHTVKVDGLYELLCKIMPYDKFLRSQVLKELSRVFTPTILLSRYFEVPDDFLLEKLYAIVPKDRIKLRALEGLYQYAVIFFDDEDDAHKLVAAIVNHKFMGEELKVKFKV